MDTEYKIDTYKIISDIIFKKAEEIGLERLRPEVSYARLNNKKEVKAYKSQVKMNKRNYDVYEMTTTIDGETWLMACCHGEFKESILNNLLFVFYYHIGWVQTEKELFLDAMKEAQKLLIVIGLAFIPYLMNYVYLVSGVVNFEPFVFETYWQIGFFASTIIGLFYWPLGIITGYGCAYLLFF